MIELLDIRKRLGRVEILQGLSLRLNAGDLGLLLGPNGAGKTTALRIAAGVLAEDGGSVRSAGAVLEARDRRARFAYLPQGVAFQPRLTTRQLLCFYARALGASPEAVDPALQFWGLQVHARKRSSALSGGLRQRLGLAVMSLVPPKVLLLDEPGISLDAEWRECMQDWLKELAQGGAAVLVATHLLGEWEGRANRCLLCREGRVVDELDPARLRQEGSLKVRAEIREKVS